MKTKKMAKFVFLIFLGFLLMARLANAICCEAIKSQIDKKIEANKTLCATESNLPPNCCEDIAREIEKHITAYKTLCATCQYPMALGMQSGKIPDDAITASSTYSTSYLAAYGRLNIRKGNCAWTTSSNGRSSSWFQVDLGQLTIVTGIATQGSCVASAEWTRSYSISYSIDAKNWTIHQDAGGVKVLNGNSDGNSIVTNVFQNPIHARYMRVEPKSYRSYPALRVEFYGCHQ